MKQYINELLAVLKEYHQLGIANQIDYQKFYLYSIITHSTAIEGSTVTEIENMLLFDEGISAKGKPMVEQLMNLDLKRAYEQSISWAKEHKPFTIEMLQQLSAIVMRNTGSHYSTLGGEFDSSKGDLSFDAHNLLVTIHPWVDGNGRMSRLIMNYLQFEFGLIPTKVLKEDKAAYIEALNQSREEETTAPFQQFMLQEHSKNLRNEIEVFKKSIAEDVIINENKVVQKGGPENKEVVQKGGSETRNAIIQLIADNANITSRDMANKLNINRSAILKHLKKLQEENLIAREGSQKSGRWIILRK